MSHSTRVRMFTVSGAMFYEMLSGKRPFEATTVSGVINRHLYEPPPPFCLLARDPAKNLDRNHARPRERSGCSATVSDGTSAANAVNLATDQTDKNPDFIRVIRGSFTRVSTAIQFTSHVLPPSSENACSNRYRSCEIFVITNRTSIARPLYVSWL